MILVTFTVDGATVVAKIAEGREEEVLDRADARFGFKGTPEQKLARAHLADRIIAARKEKKR